MKFLGNMMIVPQESPTAVVSVNWILMIKRYEDRSNMFTQWASMHSVSKWTMCAFHTLLKKNMRHFNERINTYIYINIFYIIYILYINIKEEKYSNLRCILWRFQALQGFPAWAFIHVVSMWHRHGWEIFQEFCVFLINSGKTCTSWYLSSLSRTISMLSFKRLFI